MTYPQTPLARAAQLIAEGRAANRNAGVYPGTTGRAWRPADAEEREHARAIIRRAEALGFVREPSMSDAYEAYLMADAKDAALYLATAPEDRDPEGFIDDNNDDPDCCPECGSVRPCDCVVYLVQR